MSARVAIKIMVLLFLLSAAAPAALAQQPSRCTQISELSSADGEIGTLSTTPARVCSVEIIATAANAWFQLFDSSNNTTEGNTVKTISEPGAATSGNSAHNYYGEEGVPTQFGLAYNIKNCRAIVRWGQ